MCSAGACDQFVCCYSIGVIVSITLNHHQTALQQVMSRTLREIIDTTSWQPREASEGE